VGRVDVPAPLGRLHERVTLAVRGDLDPIDRVLPVADVDPLDVRRRPWRCAALRPEDAPGGVQRRDPEDRLAAAAAAPGGPVPAVPGAGAAAVGGPVAARQGGRRLDADALGELELARRSGAGAGPQAHTIAGGLERRVHDAEQAPRRVDAL